MPKYLLLLNSSEGDFSGYSPEEIQGIIEEYVAWGKQLAERGSLISSEKLKDEGGRNVWKEDGLVVDGPMSETKEVVGGFYLIEADSYQNAIDLCRNSPHLTYSGRIEVREIEDVH